MEKTPKEVLKAYVDSQKFSSTTQIMDAMKEKISQQYTHIFFAQACKTPTFSKLRRYLAGNHIRLFFLLHLLPLLQSAFGFWE